VGSMVTLDCKQELASNSGINGMRNNTLRQKFRFIISPCSLEPFNIPNLNPAVFGLSEWEMKITNPGQPQSPRYRTFYRKTRIRAGRSKQRPYKKTM
jgi:hypothetical protein